MGYSAFLDADSSASRPLTATSTSCTSCSSTFKTYRECCGDARVKARPPAFIGSGGRTPAPVVLSVAPVDGEGTRSASSGFGGPDGGGTKLAACAEQSARTARGW